MSKFDLRNVETKQENMNIRTSMFRFLSEVINFRYNNIAKNICGKIHFIKIDKKDLQHY